MFDLLLSIAAPHLCYGCGKNGALLCTNCKYNISLEKFSACLSCGRPAGVGGICRQCQVPYSRAWCVGKREQEIEQLIDVFKFERTQAARRPLAALLDGALPVLPPDIVIVPIPTISAHVRRRGYDHALLLAREFANRRKVSCRAVLERATTTVQQGANRRTRFTQAKGAFRVRRDLPPITYLLIDDIVTTGATLHYGAQTLLDAGAAEVWVAAVAHQPSTK